MMNPQTRALVIYIGRLTLICGLTLFLFNLFASTFIQKHIHQDRLRSLSALLPSATVFIPYSKGKTIEDASIIVGRDANKKKVGYVILSEGYGFGGPIQLLVGISGSKITGIQILAHKEPSGMGSLITDTKTMPGQFFSFQGQFKGKSIFDRFSTHEDIIPLTGATISSQGVGDGILKAIKIYRRLENVQYES
jgi:RnfABCDGE-type electron transport complex G subunit